MSAEDYCDLCDLPKSQCVHGLPPAPAKPTPRQPAPQRSRPARPRTSTTSRPPVRSTPRRWTPPEAFAPDIVAVLREAGGRLEQDELFGALEERMAERLTGADHERTPEGELRWRYAARRARQALIADGAMTKDRPGVWALSSSSR